MTAGKQGLWQPPGETIEAIAAVLGARWAAAKSQQAELFRPGSGSWLGQAAWRPRVTAAWGRVVPVGARITTSRVAADSSDTLPDLHPC
jgi:hypothetical protein